MFSGALGVGEMLFVSWWLPRQVGLPSNRDRGNGRVVPAPYTVWVQAPAHVRPVDGVPYGDIPTTRLPAPIEREILGSRRPTGWVLRNLDARRGPDRGVLHAPDCEEAPQGKPVPKVAPARSAVSAPCPDRPNLVRPHLRQNA